MTSTSQSTSNFSVMQVCLSRDQFVKQWLMGRGYIKGWPSSLLKLRGLTNFTIYIIYRQSETSEHITVLHIITAPHSFLTQAQPLFRSHGKGECPGNSKQVTQLTRAPMSRKQMPMMICLDSRRSSPDDPGRDNQENSAHSNYIYCKFSRTNAPCLSKMITHKGEERNLQLYTVLLNRE